MELLNKNLLEIIKRKEKSTVEFKKARNKLPNNLFETICAMLNRNGGHIFLGIDDDGTILGIDKSYIQQMKKDFANLCNNPNKIEPTVYLNIYEYIIDNKEILYIPVHESSMVHKSNNIVYDRNVDGDYKVTIQERIANIYIRKRDFYTENKVFPYAEMSDLRIDLIKKARKMAINNSRKTHIWADMSDEEMLRSMDFYGKDLNTGKEGLTLAVILIFGKDSAIMSALPHHKTDAIYRVKDLDRYDDRDDIRTNLLDSYDRLIDFIDKHLNDKFYIEGTQRIDVRNKIARELCTNILMHREFSNPYPAKLIIEKDKMWTENANKAKSIGNINVQSFSPYPKNPKIARFFKEIGLVDELGSGVRNMIKYTKIYSGGVPEFKENDVFTTIIPLNATVNATVNATINAPIKLNNTQKLIIKLMKEDNKITEIKLSKIINVNESTIKRNVNKLKNEGVLKRIGSHKSGYWEIC